MQCDVVIVGGGLAGLSLALQLGAARRDLAIVVLERERHPVPTAGHKVGESTVEIGAHYLAEVLGLRDYLETEQLRKFGLRFFFGGESGVRDIAALDELGISDFLTVPSYQLDRGLLENHLARIAVARGVRFLDGHRVSRVDLSADGHRVSAEDGEKQIEVRARWLVDAGSRASPLRRKLELAKPSRHDNFAVWWRLGREVRIDHWSGDADWQSRVRRERWLSTNHFMGPGYWLWIIPLASGCTSIGIVADPALHDFAALRDPEAALRWVAGHQPVCLDALSEARGDLIDFRYLRTYSHSAHQVYSTERWALTGEAGVFLDPFYSPGSDFIAISNGYITEMICRDLAGRLAPAELAALQSIYFSLFKGCLELFRGQYPGFGDWRLMLLKTSWDYSYYWGILAQLYFAGVMTDVGLMSELAPRLFEARQLHVALQARFRERAARGLSQAPRGRFADHRDFGRMTQLNGTLLSASADTLQATLPATIELLRSLAAEIDGRLDGTANGPTTMLGCLPAALQA